MLQNGDCFFDALCKAFKGADDAAQPQRSASMWNAAFGSGGVFACSAAGAGASAAGDDADGGDADGGDEDAPITLDATEVIGGDGTDVPVAAASAVSAAAPSAPPPPSDPLTVRELRGVVGAHYSDEAWLIGASIGGESFAHIVEDSLELTRANVAACADDAGEHAYWADESAIAVVQAYLHVRLLIFNPLAAAGNRCHCAGESVSAPRRYVLLAHTHRANKQQHYELYARPTAGGEKEAVFTDASLPAGVKRAFADVCPDAGQEWKHARDPEPDGAGGSA